MFREITSPILFVSSKYAELLSCFCLGGHQIPTFFWLVIVEFINGRKGDKDYSIKTQQKDGIRALYTQHLKTTN